MHYEVKKKITVLLFLYFLLEKYCDLKEKIKYCTILKVVKFYIAHSDKRLNSNCNCSKDTVLYYRYSFLVRQNLAALFKQDVSFILVRPLAMLKWSQLGL